MLSRTTLWFSFVLVGIFVYSNSYGQGVIIGQPIDLPRDLSVNHRTDDLFHIREAEIRQRQMDFEGAEMAYDNAISLFPQSADLLIRRAIFRQRYGMVANAKADFELAKRLNPYALDLYGVNGSDGIAKVIAYEPEESLEKLETDQRIGYYYEMIDRLWIQERIEEPKLNLVENIVVLLDEGELTKASSNCQALLEIYPNSAIGHDLLGVVQLKSGNLKEAILAFEKAVELAPDYAIAWYNLGRAERQRGHSYTAKYYLDKAIELQDDLTKALFDRALVSKALGQTDEAIKDYTSVIEKGGAMFLEAFINRGLAKKLKGDFFGALADLNFVIDNSEANAELYKNRGNLNFIFGYYNEAIEDYSKAIQLNPDYAVAYHNRALVYFLSNFMDSGCADLQESASLGLESANSKMPYFCTW
ncbi:MAG: tetratricopeptide repeat protein [Bacteroidia bacterium]|nr:tetratricopeptide repeat protein [Bacteroidia bacterium]